MSDHIDELVAAIDARPTMSERLARISIECDRIHPLTVFATDGDMVAFKYDDGGYGWAKRSSFVPLEKAERLMAERIAEREHIRRNEYYRIEALYRKRIADAEREVDRLHFLLGQHLAKEATDE